MDDKELNRALRAYSEAWRRYVATLADPASPRVEPKLHSAVQAAINKLRTEAERVVRDPGGPLSNYSDALATWAEANHPEIDSSEMSRHITEKLVLDHFW
ncbi:hypothetical protein M1E17_18960 [Arthrobacter sp. D1-29]